jgi:hypothetical protein
MAIERLKSDITATCTHPMRNSSLDACKSPLYLTLAATEAAHWHSYSVLQQAPTIEGLALQFFQRVEVEHGQPVVATLLGFLVAGRIGLSMLELVDLMAGDAAVAARNKTKEDATHHVHRHRWLHFEPATTFETYSILEMSLMPYLQQKTADGALGFKHPCVEAIARERYLPATIAGRVHLQLVDYFLGMKWQDGAGSVPQPMIYSTFDAGQGGKPRPSKYNARLISELPAQIASCPASAVYNDRCTGLLLHRALSAVVLTLEFVEMACALSLVYDYCSDLLRIQNLLQQVLAKAAASEAKALANQAAAATQTTAPPSSPTTHRPSSAAKTHSPSMASSSPTTMHAAGVSTHALQDLLQRTRNLLRFLESPGVADRLCAAPWETMQLVSTLG